MAGSTMFDDALIFELKRPSRRGKNALSEQFQAQLVAAIEQLEQHLHRDNDINMLLIAANDAKEIKHIDALVRLVRHRVRELEQTEMERLIDMSMPQVDLQHPREVLDQARRNAQLRAHFLETWACLDAEAVHTLYGSTADNTAALAGKWRKTGKIFAVDYQGRTLYPAFQFDLAGRPKPVIAKILKALGPRMGAWQTAIWFISANPGLGRELPVEVLDDIPEQVVNVAKALTEPNLF